MTLADTNFWLALSLSKHQFHRAVRDWLSKQPDASVLFCRATQQSFLRLLTTDSVLRLYDLPAMTNAAAWTVYDAFLADRRIRFTNEPSAIDARWKRFTARSSASPKLWMDAYLAAFAISSGHHFVTTDKAFRQFDGLHVVVIE